MADVLRWPLREGLLCFLNILREKARRNYEIELLMWSSLLPYQKEPADMPKPPEILRDR